jgi:formylglycine-generating enzyme required for sulfatase activity
MCVDLVTKSNVVWYLNADDVPGGVTADIYKTDKLLMRRIHAEGIRWLMGLPKAGGTGDNWEPGHFVTLTNDYYMAIFEMTIGQRSRIVSGTTASNGDYPDRSTSYEGLRGATSGHDWPSDGHKVSGDSVLGKLRSHAGINGFDLPTQAEWEYAARAGNLGYCYYHWGFDTSKAAFEPYEWINDTVPSSAAQKVGLLLPNQFGLYDMHGNCFERCLDYYAAADGYSKHGSDVIAPPGPTMGTARVIHGGGYTHASGPAYIFYREGYSPDASNDTNIGYRLACCADFRDVQ